MYCQAPAVMPANTERPASISSCQAAMLPQRPTTLPFAITAIGESRCVRKRPIGLPDCTASGWASSIGVGARGDRALAWREPVATRWTLAERMQQRSQRHAAAHHALAEEQRQGRLEPRYTGARREDVGRVLELARPADVIRGDLVDAA